MKFSIGDLVYLKRTGEEGRITNLIGKAMLEVDVNGICFPVYEDEVDHPYLRWFTEKKATEKKQALPETLPVEKTETRMKRLPQGVYLSFLPVYKLEMMEDIVDQIRLHLLNELPITVQFDYEVRSAKGEIIFRHSGTLQPFQNLYLHYLSLEEASAQPRYHWRLKGEATGTSKQVALSEVLRVRAARLFEQLHAALQDGRPTFAYKLIEDFVPVQQQKYNVEAVMPMPAGIDESKNSALLKQVPQEVLDLHAEHLDGYDATMENAEILRLQLRAAESFIDQAVVHQLQRIAVIHGIGKGVLRDEIHRMIASHREVKRFTNEWEPKFGFGATIIWLRG